jgi:hypothetical protein
MNYPQSRRADQSAPPPPNQNFFNAGQSREQNSERDYGFGESSSNAIQLIIGFIWGLRKIGDERDANSVLTKRQLYDKGQKEGDELLKVAFWQIVYPVIRIAIVAFVMWMVYLAVKGAHESLSHVSWDLLGIGLCLIIPIAYMIAVARRERYGDGGPE